MFEGIDPSSVVPSPQLEAAPPPEVPSGPPVALAPAPAPGDILFVPTEDMELFVTSLTRLGYDEGPLMVIGTPWSWGGGGGGSGYGGGGHDSNTNEQQGGGGGQGGPANPYEFSFTEDDAACAKGAALKLGSHMHDVLEALHGKYEFGALIVRQPDGSYGALDDGIHTDFSPDTARLTPEEDIDYSTIVGIVQSQPYNTDVDHFRDNYLNRYPSDGDWEALETLARLGADPARLSIFITDPWGVTREFKRSDKAMYDMDDPQRVRGDNLPPPTSPCGG